jgi:hypothetical protein
MMKTRIEVLEVDHDSALAQLVENEINVKLLKGKEATTPPGEKTDELKKMIDGKLANIDQITKVLAITEEMIKEEAEKCKNLN